MLWTHPWAVRLRRASMVVPWGATMHHKGARPMTRKSSVHGIDIATCQHEPKCSCSPGSGHCIMPKRPVSDNVMDAVRLSGPPKHMLVGYTSGILTARTRSPAGENSVIEPVVSVATAMLPLAITAKLSKRAWPGSPAITRPLCGRHGSGARSTPGASTSKAHNRAPSVSATESIVPSGESPQPLGLKSGNASSTIFEPSGKAS